VTPYNPYAAPAAPAPVIGGVPPVGEPQPWSIGDAIRGGWDAYKANWAALTLGYLIATFIGGTPGQVAPVLALTGVLSERTVPYYAVHVPLTIVGWLVAEFLTAGFTRAALQSIRTGHASIGDFFRAGERYVPFVLCSLLRTMATAFGLILLVVPGIIVALGFANAPFYVIDQRLGPVEALRASWRSTDGQKGELFLLSLAEIGITLVGLLAACLGIFVAVPVMLVARAIVYTKMSGTAAPAPPAGGMGAPYPGGYGGFGPPAGPAGGYGPYGTYGGTPPAGGFGGQGPR
jgi:hypothetical protein